MKWRERLNWVERFLPNVAEVERRCEPRYEAQGQILLKLDGMSYPVVAQLLDISASGFRARHACQSIESGDRILFSHDQGTGEAVAIWKRVMGDEVEGGFLISTAPYTW